VHVQPCNSSDRPQRLQAQLYVDTDAAAVLLRPGEVDQADEVVAAAEGVGLDPGPALLADLRAALKGRPRPSEVRQGRRGGGCV
jgi:hypothetical protein